MQFVERDCGYVTPCWIYQGTQSGDYGVFGLQSGPQKASRSGRVYIHRLSYFLATGELPPQVNHYCDIPLCGRFDHLWDGDQHANLMDASLKGRMDKKINGAQRRELAQRFLVGNERSSALAEEYGVSVALVHAAASRYRPYIEGAPPPRRKLTLEERQEIIVRLSQGEPHAQIAHDYNITRSAVTAIKARSRDLRWAD
jgi:transposase-like protein